MCSHGHLAFFAKYSYETLYSPLLLSCAHVAAILIVIRRIIYILHASLLTSFLHVESKANHVSTLKVVQISSVPD